MALTTWPAPLSSTTSIALVTAGALAVYHVVAAAYQWYRLRRVPGPWLAGFSYLWIFQVLARGKHQPFAELGKRYGHVVRVGPNMLLTDLPDVLRRISGTRSVYGKDGM